MGTARMVGDRSTTWVGTVTMNPGEASSAHPSHDPELHSPACHDPDGEGASSTRPSHYPPNSSGPTTHALAPCRARSMSTTPAVPGASVSNESRSQPPLFATNTASALHTSTIPVSRPSRARTVWSGSRSVGRPCEGSPLRAAEGTAPRAPNPCAPRYALRRILGSRRAGEAERSGALRGRVTGRYFRDCYLAQPGGPRPCRPPMSMSMLGRRPVDRVSARNRDD